MTASIQAPDFGSRMEKPAIAQNGTPIPIAYVASKKKPVNAFRVVATNARMPARGGPVQGAAISPPTSPIRNAPPALRPPTRLSRCCSPDGSPSSNAPNIDAAISAKNNARGTITHGLARNEPNALPTSANTVPSVPNITAMPAT